MPNPFTAHPASVGQTYGQHLRFALTFGARMTLGGLAASLHGLFPFLIVAATGISFSMSRWLVFSRKPDPRIGPRSPHERPIVQPSTAP